MGGFLSDDDDDYGELSSAEYTPSKANLKSRSVSRSVMRTRSMGRTEHADTQPSGSLPRKRSLKIIQSDDETDNFVRPSAVDAEHGSMRNAEEEVHRSPRHTRSRARKIIQSDDEADTPGQPNSSALEPAERQLSPRDKVRPRLRD